MGPNKNALDFGASVGFAALLFSYSEHHERYTCTDLQKHFVHPYRLGQYKFYFNGNGDVVAVVTWAWVSEYGLQRLINDDYYDMHPSEWNEGDILFLMDVVAPFGHFREVVADLFRGDFISINEAYSVRRAHDVKIRKVTRWTRKALASRGFL